MHPKIEARVTVVTIWFQNADCTQETVGLATNLLQDVFLEDPPEVQRISLHRKTGDRLRCALGRIALRLACLVHSHQIGEAHPIAIENSQQQVSDGPRRYLSAVIDQGTKSSTANTSCLPVLSIGRLNSGKPVVVHPAGLSVSVSHHDNVVSASCSAACDNGIDVVNLHSFKRLFPSCADVHETFSSMLADQEKRLVFECNLCSSKLSEANSEGKAGAAYLREASCAEKFLMVWAAKECVGKIDGRGIGCPWQKFSASSAVTQRKGSAFQQRDSLVAFWVNEADHPSDQKLSIKFPMVGVAWQARDLVPMVLEDASHDIDGHTIAIVVPLADCINQVHSASSGTRNNSFLQVQDEECSFSSILLTSPLSVARWPVVRKQFYITLADSQTQVDPAELGNEDIEQPADSQISQSEPFFNVELLSFSIQQLLGAFAPS